MFDADPVGVADCGGGQLSAAAAEKEGGIQRTMGIFNPLILMLCFFRESILVFFFFFFFNVKDIFKYKKLSEN